MEVPFERIKTGLDSDACAYVVQHYVFLRRKQRTNGFTRIVCREQKKLGCKAVGAVRGDCLMLEDDCHNHAAPDIDEWMRNVKIARYNLIGRNAPSQALTKSKPTFKHHAPSKKVNQHRKPLLPKHKPSSPQRPIAGAVTMTPESGDSFHVVNPSNDVSLSPTPSSSPMTSTETEPAPSCSSTSNSGNAVPFSAVNFFGSPAIPLQNTPAATAVQMPYFPTQQQQFLPNLEDENMAFAHFVSLKLAKLNPQAAARAQAEIAQILSAVSFPDNTATPNAAVENNTMCLVPDEEASAFNGTIIIKTE